MRRPGRFAVVAAGAVSLAACAQILGIQDIHDDPADGAPVDANGEADSTAHDGGLDALEAGDAEASVSESGADVVADGPPGPDPSLGCPAGDGGYYFFLHGTGRTAAHVAVDTTYVYVATDTSLLRCSVEGCDGGVITLETHVVNDVASNGKHIVWSDPTGVTYVHVSDPGGNDVGGTRMTGPDLVTAAGDDLYAQGPAGIAHLVDTPVGLDASTSWLEQQVADYGALAASPAAVAFTQVDEAGTTSVFTCPPAGCAVAMTTIAQVPPVGTLPAVFVAVDGAHVYWSDPNAQTINACPIAGCSTGPTPVATSVIASSLAVDGRGLYWGAGPDNGPYPIYRVPLDGGPAVFVANAVYAPANIVASAACVYWSTHGNIGANTPGAVFAAPQP